jgi:hypothetical protein
MKMVDDENGRDDGQRFHNFAIINQTSWGEGRFF